MLTQTSKSIKKIVLPWIQLLISETKPKISTLKSCIGITVFPSWHTSSPRKGRIIDLKTCLQLYSYWYTWSSGWRTVLWKQTWPLCWHLVPKSPLFTVRLSHPSVASWLSESVIRALSERMQPIPGEVSIVKSQGTFLWRCLPPALDHAQVAQQGAWDDNALARWSPYSCFSHFLPKVPPPHPLIHYRAVILGRPCQPSKRREKFPKMQR